MRYSTKVRTKFTQNGHVLHIFYTICRRANPQYYSNIGNIDRDFEDWMPPLPIIKFKFS